MDDKEDKPLKSSENDEALLSEIRKFYDYANGYWSPIYLQGREDKEFVTIDGMQWDADAKKERDCDNLPSLSINLTRTYCRQQINTQRQNRPQIDPIPVDSNADIETAKTIKGLVKDTEVISDAESAYDAAAENAVYGGIGFIRVTTDYVSDDSFDQEPRIIAVHNSESILIDPTSKALDGSDNTRALVMSWEDKQKIIDEHGEDAVSDFESIDKMYTSWFNISEEKVLIAEYFYLDQEKKELCLLGDGSTKWKDELIAGENVLKTRTSFKKTIKWCKVSGSKVLDRTEFVGQHIPVVPVYGEVTWIGEDRYVYSLVHFAKDPQRLYNYWKSTEAHQLAEMSDAPYVAAVGQLEGYEEEWQNPKGLRVLHYNNVDDVTGQPLSPPQRQGFPGSPTGVLNAAMGAQQSITDVLNMHAPAMGSSQNDQSGVALGKLQNQQETSNYHFPDNLNKSIAQIGRILLPCYQAFYTDERIKRIMGEDGKPKMVTLNAPPEGELKKDQKLSKNGWLNDLTVGRYDIRMQTGANFNTQRQETAALLQQLVQADPSIMQVAGDLVLRSIDGVGINEIADRVERTIPPNIKNDTEQQPQLPPEVQQHLQQADMQMQQIQQALQQAQKIAEDKQAQMQVDLQKAQLDSDTKIHIAQLNNDSKSDINELTQAVKLMLQNMQPPPQLVQDVNQDLAEEEMPELDLGVPIQQDYALDDSQIENNVPQMVAATQDVPDVNQG